MTDPRAVRAAQAASFDGAAQTYERARPSDPQEAVDWLLESSPQDVLDLGAGTGKVTRAFVGRVRTIVAVDPSANMLAQLAGSVPQARTVVGTAESIPIEDHSVEPSTRRRRGTGSTPSAPSPRSGACCEEAGCSG